MAAMLMVLIYNLADTFFIGQTHDEFRSCRKMSDATSKDASLIFQQIQIWVYDRNNSFFL